MAPPNRWVAAGLFVVLIGGLLTLLVDRGPGAESLLMGDGGRRPELALADLPQSVRDTVAREVGQAQPREIGQDDDDDTQVTYEIDFVVNGRDVELRVAVDGMLLYRKDEIAPGQLPQAVKDAIAQASQGREIDWARKMADGKGVRYDIGTEGDLRVEMTLGEDGKVLRMEEAMTLAMLPAAVRELAMKEMEGAKIDDMVRITRDGKTIYEIDGEDAARKCRLEISENGELLEKGVEEK